MKLRTAPVICFARFRYEPTEERLFRGSRALDVSPKALAVLRCLLARPGELVTKGALLDEVWPGTHVGEAVLSVCVAELRKALGDRAARPRLIETVRARGYRFIGRVSSAGTGGTARGRIAWRPRTNGGSGEIATPPLAPPTAQLERAAAGERQTLFVAGDAAAARRALVSALIDDAAARKGFRVTGAECVTPYGEGGVEPYRPVFEAISRLCKTEDRDWIVDLLVRYAPTWLARLPWLVPSSQRSKLRSLLAGDPGQMLREMMELIDALSDATPLLIVFEELQCSDDATIDLLAALARRPEPARIVLVGTYAPASASADHPFHRARGELVAAGLADEIGLSGDREHAFPRSLRQRAPSHG